MPCGYNGKILHVDLSSATLRTEAPSEEFCRKYMGGSAIKAELGDHKIKVLQIGPAGEKRVRFASLINNCNRANGRTGMGAAMGSKNLKAVAVRGTQRPALADQKAFKALVRQGGKDFPASMIASMGKYGTSGAVSGNQSLGGLPSYNYNSGVFDNWEQISGQTMYDTIRRGCEDDQQQKYGRDTCFGCIVHCKPVVEIKKGPYAVSPTYGGPEYETLASFGSYCGIDDLAAIAKANEICNQ